MEHIKHHIKSHITVSKRNQEKQCTYTGDTNRLPVDRRTITAFCPLLSFSEIQQNMFGEIGNSRFEVTHETHRLSVSGVFLVRDLIHLSCCHGDKYRVVSRWQISFTCTTDVYMLCIYISSCLHHESFGVFVCVCVRAWWILANNIFFFFFLKNRNWPISIEQRIRMFLNWLAR